ncbi:hypothetical protein [Psychrobacter sp. W2-37-MNA-CIBAN-0211]|uniref:hypothetical protein n=1 Tax=Psychrobacter sp. W2-37-MNA-CIBAN-0211 TaxID=3140443 RepID=UPI0033315DAC
MNIQLEDGSQIGGGNLISAIYRTDLVPVPVTLEMVVKADDRLRELLIIGKPLLTPKGVPLVIVKSQVVNEQSIKAGKRIAAIHIIAVMAGCEPLLGVTTKAVYLENTSFNEVYRALGAKVRIKRDIKLASFICLKGQLPTKPIALALQKEAAVMVNTEQGLSVIRLNDLMAGEPLMFDKSAVQWVDNPNAIRHGNINYLSIDDNGSDIVGTVRSERSIQYYPRADNRELQNLRRILITKAKITRQLDERLDAGKLIDVDGKRLVVLTGAHNYESGALGGRSVMATKAWLAQIEDAK